ncbi:hypothetical protein [Halopelagius longus]|uniref:Uncharacterized protein n=1 Tax=Halopelagius longus TaxID=1236180 RepID=A0A1H1GM08_9EURY|nr:hypothetical protein [Halopelagius longus]RDI69662.1 hypothetical protein DWB78_17990 [Halopelagius longus]SDR14215.1 hypothetical protein SAMN05216278_3760 [Halopelagius longus]
MSNEPDDADVRRTTEPTLARTVIENHGGYPAHEPQSEGQGDGGLLRVGMRDENEDLKEISWEAFEDEFEEKDLELVYAEDAETDVGGDKPLRLVERESDQE